MSTTVRILGSRAREQVPGTGITLLAPGFQGCLEQLTPGVAPDGARPPDFDLPFAEAAAGAEAMLAAQLTLNLEAPAPSLSTLRSRSAVVAHPRVIVPRRAGVAYALLQTDETGTSSFLAPLPGDEEEAVFPLSIASGGITCRTLRVLMWPNLNANGPGSLAVASRWERLRRPHQLAQRVERNWQPPDFDALAKGPVLLLLHDTFSTSQATFADWIDDESFAPMAWHYGGRCLAFTHPTLATGIDENLGWLVEQLASLPGPFDIVAHGRGGLLARALAVDGRLPLRRVVQVGTPNNGTLLARESHLTHFLDGHVSMLARTRKDVGQATLEGALCLARGIAQGLRAALPGIEVLTPDSAPLRALADFRRPELEWYTVGAQFEPPTGHGHEFGISAFSLAPNDGVVPTPGCHEPGIPVADSLHLGGGETHHHSYFADGRVREKLAVWLGDL